MPSEERASRGGSRQLTVRFSIEGVQSGQSAPELRVYLFTHNGSLVDSRPARGESVTFAIDPGRDYRVTVGPDVMRGEVQPADLTGTLLKARQPQPRLAASDRARSTGVPDLSADLALLVSGLYQRPRHRAQTAQPGRGRRRNTRQSAPARSRSFRSISAAHWTASR